MQTIIDGEYKITTLPNGTVIREINSAPPAQAPENTKLTRLAFRNRFTPAEKIALYTAAKNSVEIQIYLDDLRDAKCADLVDAELIRGINGLVAAAILTPQRAEAILTAPVTPDEAY